MDSDTVIASVLLALGVVALILFSAAEAGIISGVRERALKEPTESPVEALRRFYQERQLTLSSLALARNLASVGITGIAVYLVLRETSDSWAALLATIVLGAVALVVLQGFTRVLISNNPQRWQTLLNPLVLAVRFVFRVPVLMLDAPMGAVIHAWQRDQPGAGAGAEELTLLAEMDAAAAGLEQQEREMIRGVMELEFTMVREVMIPRPDIVAQDVNAGFEALAEMMVQHGFSRIPVYEGDIDHVLGIAHAKEMLRHLTNGPSRPPLRDVLHPAHIVPESKKVHELLSEMKEMQISIAIVVDEYGGVAGLVTLEDLIEEIVGEIRDEFDREEQPVLSVNENEAILDARVSIDDLNEMFALQIQKDDFDSVGGFIVNELGRMPSVGDTVRFNGVSLKVLSVAGRRIKKVRAIRNPDRDEGAAAETAGK